MTVLEKGICMALTVRLTLRWLVLTMGLLFALVACGSDGNTVSEAVAPENDQTTSGTAPTAAPIDAEPADTEVASGTGVTTVTMGDGTAYALELSSCDTSSTDSSFLLPDSYDISGQTSGGEIRFYMARAGLSEDFITQVATLEGDFDDGGQNAALFYSGSKDSYALIVEGPRVSGTFSLKAIGPNRPHGDEIAVAVDISC